MVVWRREGGPSCPTAQQAGEGSPWSRASGVWPELLRFTPGPAPAHGARRVGAQARSRGAHGGGQPPFLCPADVSLPPPKSNGRPSLGGGASRPAHTCRGLAAPGAGGPPPHWGLRRGLPTGLGSTPPLFSGRIPPAFNVTENTTRWVFLCAHCSLELKGGLLPGLGFPAGQAEVRWDRRQHSQETSVLTCPGGCTARWPWGPAGRGAHSRDAGGRFSVWPPGRACRPSRGPPGCERGAFSPRSPHAAAWLGRLGPGAWQWGPAGRSPSRALRLWGGGHGPQLRSCAGPKGKLSTLSLE